MEDVASKSQLHVTVVRVVLRSGQKVSRALLAENETHNVHAIDSVGDSCVQNGNEAVGLPCRLESDGAPRCGAQAGEQTCVLPQRAGKGTIFIVKSLTE